MKVPTNHFPFRFLLLESLAGLLNSLLLPVYTLKADDNMTSHFTLPAAKLVLQWVILNPAVLDDPSFRRRLQIWPSLCKLLNANPEAGSESVADEELLVLPEDCDVRQAIFLCTLNPTNFDYNMTLMYLCPTFFSIINCLSMANATANAKFCKPEQLLFQ